MSDRKLERKPDHKCKAYPYNADQIAWLHDLETTTEPQGQGYLHERDAHGTDVGFCCLGRAFIVFGIDPDNLEDKDDYTLVYDGQDGCVSYHIMKRLRLRGPLGEIEGAATTLADMNDDGRSFKDIAAYIRANPWNVFLDPEESSV